MQNIVQIDNLKFSYKEREALKSVSFSVAKGEIFGLLGPNGSGKTTLFRILSTALLPSSGDVTIAGGRIPGQYAEIRKKTGIVFQSPSLDGKLTVRENLTHAGHLYGLSGAGLGKRIDEMLSRLGLTDRARDIVEKLSGGLKRRVELAKGLLHDPVLLILDEPSTGLDPGARLDLWTYLRKLRDEKGMTILVTTHLMEEAEHCGRIAILNEGRLIALGTPLELKRQIGGDVLVIRGENPAALAKKIEEKFRLKAHVADSSILIEHERGPEFVARLAEAFPGEITSITFRKPTLEDVFVHETGHEFWSEKEEELAHV